MEQQKQDKFNLVFINVESMDGRKMGCMGEKALANATANLDNLAEQGTLFSNTYSNCPVCNPSRASMLTGTYPHHNQCWNNHEGLSSEIPIIEDYLAEAGYNTKMIGPLDYTYGKHSMRDRVGSWTRAANIHRPLVNTPLPQIKEEKGVHDADRNLLGKSVDWLRKVKDGPNPFMLYLTTGLVHPDFRAARNYVDQIDGTEIELPPADKETHPVLNYIKATKNANRDCPENTIKKIRRVYYAMIATLDDILEELFQYLDEMELKENTYVIFTSDHGEMAMEHDQVLKRTMYEPSLRVPLIIAGPGIHSGREVKKPVSLVDLFPTIMDLANIDYTCDLPGESLLPFCEKGGEEHRDWVFAEYHGDRCNTGAFMLRRGSWKYIKYVGYRPQLFNLQKDPWEVNNRAPNKPQLVDEMDKLLSDIVDYKEIDDRAKEYDRKKFAKWRKKEKKQGTYNDKMSYIYSGFWGTSINNIKQWRAEDEAQIEEWLNKSRKND